VLRGTLEALLIGAGGCWGAVGRGAGGEGGRGDRRARRGAPTSDGDRTAAEERRGRGVPRYHDAVDELQVELQ
jgi:hypothetical protein